jgi:hypothetical protein
MPALRGGVALVTTFVGLLITAWISSGLKITGASTWCWSHSSSGWLSCRRLGPSRAPDEESGRAEEDLTKLG